MYSDEKPKSGNGVLYDDRFGVSPPDSGLKGSGLGLFSLLVDELFAGGGTCSSVAGADGACAPVFCC